MSDSPGKRLRAARLEKNLSVEEITTATKMRPSMINALEADDYSHFPSITHARNFLSLYGKYLKVDVKEGVTNLATPAKMGIENYQYLNVERHENTSYRTQRRTRPNSSSRGGEQITRSLGIVAGVIAFLFFAIYLSVNLRRLNLVSDSPAPAIENDAEPTASETPISTQPNGFRSPTPTPEPSSSPFYAPVLQDRDLIKKRPWPRF